MPEFASLAHLLALDIFGTIVHEITHTGAMTEDKYFTGPLTENMGRCAPYSNSLIHSIELALGEHGYDEILSLYRKSADVIGTGDVSSLRSIGTEHAYVQSGVDPVVDRLGAGSRRGHRPVERDGDGGGGGDRSQGHGFIRDVDVDENDDMAFSRRERGEDQGGLEGGPKRGISRADKKTLAKYSEITGELPDYTDVAKLPPIVGTGTGGKITIQDVHKHVDRIMTSSAGSALTPDVLHARAVLYAVSETQARLRETEEGLTWFAENVDYMDRAMAQLHNELAYAPYRTIFKGIIASTSGNNEPVHKLGRAGRRLSDTIYPFVGDADSRSFRAQFIH